MSKKKSLPPQSNKQRKPNTSDAATLRLATGSDVGIVFTLNRNGNISYSYDVIHGGNSAIALRLSDAGLKAIAQELRAIVSEVRRQQVSVPTQE